MTTYYCHYTLEDVLMTPRKRYSFFIDEELEAGLKALKRRDGMPEAEALRRALAGFLKRKGIIKAEKTGRKRADTRKRP